MSEITVDTLGFAEAIRKLGVRLDTRAVLAAGAGAYKQEWRARFRELDAKGNRKGFPPRHFWIEEGLRKTDTAELGDQSARVTCDSRAVAKRAAGGEIRPAQAKGLAIPLTAVAYRAGWPSTSGLPLEFVPVRSKKNPRVVGKLVEARATRIGYRADGSVRKGRTNTRTAGTAHWLIMTSVTLAPMGDAVKPDRAKAERAVRAHMAAAVERQVDRARG